MKYSQGRKVFLLGLVFFMTLGTFSCKQPKNKGKKTGQDHKVSWEVDGNGAVGYEVVAKVGNKEIKKGSLHSIGTVVSFEVKNIPTTHKLIDTGWDVSNGILNVDTADSTKATLTLGLGNKNVNVVITLTIPKHKVSWEVSPDGLAKYEVEAKVGDRKIEKDGSYPEGTVISFEVKDISDSYEIKQDGWASSSGELAVNSSDFTKAILTLGKQDAHVTITLTVVKHRVSWEVIPNGATGYEVEAKVNDNVITNDSLQDEGGKISFEVVNIPTTHKIRIDGWKTSSGELACNLDDSTKATLILGKMDAHVTITLIIPKYTISWNVAPNGLTGYEVKAKVGDREIEKNSTYPEGTVVSFEVKNIPSTHELMPAGWASSSEILTINFSDYKKATLTLEKEDVTVTITLKKTGTTYNIGDEGAGGGRVFYVSQEGFRVYDGKGDDVVYHYLEMSKDTLGISKWFPEYSPMYTQDGLGYGKSNTYKILNARTSNELTDENCAVCRVSKYSTASTKVGEWWLPSKEELDLIYQNQKERVLASSTKRWHWSSSEVDGHDAWARDFGDGSWYKHYKIGSSDFSVRAVRAF